MSKRPLEDYDPNEPRKKHKTDQPIELQHQMESQQMGTDDAPPMAELFERWLIRMQSNEFDNMPQQPSQLQANLLSYSTPIQPPNENDPEFHVPLRFWFNKSPDLALPFYYFPDGIPEHMNVVDVTKDVVYDTPN